MGSGAIRFDGSVDPYAKQPIFEFNFKLNDLALKQLNPFLRAFASIDVERGTLSMDAEFAANDGRFKGYVKPFVEDLDVLRSGGEEEGLLNEVWQAVVGTAAELLEDQSRDRTGTRIPFEGNLENPNASPSHSRWPSVDVWSAAGTLLENAFIEALRRGSRARSTSRRSLARTTKRRRGSGRDLVRDLPPKTRDYRSGDVLVAGNSPDELHRWRKASAATSCAW